MQPQNGGAIQRFLSVQIRVHASLRKNQPWMGSLLVTKQISLNDYDSRGCKFRCSARPASEAVVNYFKRSRTTRGAKIPSLLKLLSGAAARPTTPWLLACPEPAGDKESSSGYNKAEGDGCLKLGAHDINVAQAAGLLFLKV